LAVRKEKNYGISSLKDEIASFLMYLSKRHPFIHALFSDRFSWLDEFLHKNTLTERQKREGGFSYKNNHLRKFIKSAC